ncbi:hypothetical protein [Burkholderia sp. BCC1047]|uniref:hypothetical protein n=1 Tax=Burkholderia sp. BCC1047 TaxID=2676299 RepID=UPI00158A7FCD|nr:hypothetical protein [Burkholderia sp. BCC1047]
MSLSWQGFQAISPPMNHGRQVDDAVSPLWFLADRVRTLGEVIAARECRNVASAREGTDFPVV